MNYKFSTLLATLTGICLLINGGEAIKGGKPVNVNEFPYVVAILRAGEFVCSGAIIHNQYILTAASCVMGEDDKVITTITNRLQVVLGITEIWKRENYSHYNSTELESKYSEAVVDIGSLYVDIHYHKRNKDYADDYALLKLDNKWLKFVPDSNLKKISLPLDDDTYENKVAILTGYGFTDFEILGSARLNKLEMTVLPNNYLNDKEKKVDKHLIVAYANRTDGQKHGPCVGDIGAPLVYGSKIIGILVGGPTDCGQENEPYYFTRVSSHVGYLLMVFNNKWTINHPYFKFLNANRYQ